MSTGGASRVGEDSEVLLGSSGRIAARSPSSSTGYWRISVCDETGRRIKQTTGGRTRADALRRVMDLERSLAAHAPAGAAATHGDHLLDHYLDERRPKNRGNSRRLTSWSITYADANSRLVDKYLRPVLGSVPLAAWSPSHAYRVLDRCTTNSMMDRVRALLSAIIGVGISDGFLRADQHLLHKVTVPMRPESGPPRRTPARTADATSLLQGDDVPSRRQVRALAEATAPGTSADQWSAVINTLAFGGLRIGELFALSSGDAVGLHESGLLRVQCQLVEPRGRPKCLAPPKNGYARLVAIW